MIEESIIYGKQLNRYPKRIEKEVIQARMDKEIANQRAEMLDPSEYDQLKIDSLQKDSRYVPMFVCHPPILSRVRFLRNCRMLYIGLNVYFVSYCLLGIPVKLDMTGIFYGFTSIITLAHATIFVTNKKVMKESTLTIEWDFLMEEFVVKKPIGILHNKFREIRVAPANFV